MPLFQSESKCKTILMKMTLICMKMNLHAELIFIWKVSHLDSFWNRGTRELGNGLFFVIQLFSYWRVCTPIIHRLLHASVLFGSLVTLNYPEKHTLVNCFSLSISMAAPSVPAVKILSSSDKNSECDTGLPAKWKRTIVWKTNQLTHSEGWA